MIKIVNKYLIHIFIDGLSGMALGLFSTLIIGTILQQIANLLGGSIGSTLFLIGKVATCTTCAGIGVGGHTAGVYVGHHVHPALETDAGGHAGAAAPGRDLLEVPEGHPGILPSGAQA